MRLIDIPSSSKADFALGRTSAVGEELHSLVTGSTR